MRNQRRQVIRIVIHVVAIAGLSRPAVAAPVMSYDAIAVVEEEQHLRVPIVGRQRPTMAEHDRLTLAPILVENLDAVFRFDGIHLDDFVLLARAIQQMETRANKRTTRVHQRIEYLAATACSMWRAENFEDGNYVCAIAT